MGSFFKVFIKLKVFLDSDISENFYHECVLIFSNAFSASVDTNTWFFSSQQYAEEKKKETEKELAEFAAKQAADDKAKVNGQTDPTVEDDDGNEDVWVHRCDNPLSQ